MKHEFSPLATWADRNPRVRWPLVLISLFLAWGFNGWLAPSEELANEAPVCVTPDHTNDHNHEAEDHAC